MPETADPCGQGSKQTLDCWDRGFESDSSSLVFVVFCVGTGLCDGLITRSKKPYRVCLCLRPLCVIYRPQK
jgi:hypothetical protein